MEGLESILADGNDKPEQTPEGAPQGEHDEGQQDSQTTGEVAASPAAGQQDDWEKQRKGLEAAALAERQRRQALERQLADLQRQQQPAQQQPQQAAPKFDGLERPKRDQFPDQEQYEDALLEYGDKKREARDLQARQQREQQDQETQFWQAVDTMVGRGQSKFPDFDVVVNAGLGKHLASQSQQAHALRFALSQSERGEEIAYHLGKNSAEADRIAALPPARMLHAVGVIEAKLDSGAEQSTQQTRPVIPQTLTTQRNAAGRFTPAYSGPTPLDEILAAKR
ncbi:MAG: hypothetical protein RLZZ182_534 [Pseudomonadota bacterium]|jgi:hypothetical protein